MGKYDFLKSGTDVRGIAVEYLGKPVELTDEAVYDIAAAFAAFVSAKTGKKAEDVCITVGHDSRISAHRIAAAVLKALKNCGVKALYFDLASTPAMFMSTVELCADGAIQITASHHPYFRNGLKFFTREGGAEGSDIVKILSDADKKNYDDSKCGTVENYDFMPRYAEILRDTIKKGVNAADYDHPLAGKKIIVDAGNGVGGFYASEVLAPLGADTSGSQFLEPDGMFPNHIPNPENEEAMCSICSATVANHADLGIIFDTDVDRGGAVDANGEELNKNNLLAIAAYIAAGGESGKTIVTDSITSDGFKEFIEKDMGCHHHRFVRGYKNVINEAIRLNKEGIDTPLAGETAGHIAFRENYFLDDGAYLITKIVIEMMLLAKEGKTLNSIIAGMRQPVEAAELRMDILKPDFKAYGQSVIDSIEAYAAAHEDWLLADDSREGVRVNFAQADCDGWFVLRLSVHDPVLPLNVESNVAGGVKNIVKKIYEVVKPFDGLELSAFEKYID
ncbi:MAG: phosphomannomutase/phosphoglucomutase [Clostridia bacterium]|nr:phosphomannomutase/phosphoglucomutase [Clostridia bacterium]